MSCSNKIKTAPCSVVWVQSCWCSGGKLQLPFQPGLEIATSRLYFTDSREEFLQLCCKVSFIISKREIQLWMSTACRICQLCLECCRSSLWTKGKGRSKPLWAVNWALFDHACVGKSVVQECCQRKGMCSGRLCIWKDSLCSQKVASICMAAIREGKSANPSAFSWCSWGWYPFAKAGFAGSVAVRCLCTEYLVTLLNCIWKYVEDFLLIPGWTVLWDCCSASTSKMFYLKTNRLIMNFRKQIWCQMWLICGCFCLLPCVHWIVSVSPCFCPFCSPVSGVQSQLQH